jgi:hypothetical protein
METYDGDPNIFTRANAGDDSLFVVFYMGVIRNEARTIEEGRPIFDDVECVRIIIPGDKNNVLDRPANARDKQRFSKQYSMFKAGLSEDDQVSGTRLTEWPFLSRGQAEELKHLGIKTVEQLAEVRDDIVSRVPGLTTLKQNASAWLGKAKGAAEAAKTAKLIADQQSQIETLQTAVREQAARIEKMLLQSGVKA